MEYEAILRMLVDKMPIMGAVLMVLGALVVIGMAIVAATPSKDDDAFVAKLDAMPIVGSLIKALMAFSPFQKKP